MQLNKRTNYPGDRFSSELRKPGLLSSMGFAEKLIMSVAFGGILGLSASGFDIWWLAWIGLIPLLVLVQSTDKDSEAGLLGLAFGMGYNMVALSWCLGSSAFAADKFSFQVSILVWLFRSFYQSLLMAFFAFFVHALPMRAGILPHFVRPYFPYVIAVPIIWIFTNWSIGISTAFHGMPIIQLAYSQSHQLQLIQLTKLGGAQMLEFIIVLFNSALAGIFIQADFWENMFSANLVYPLAARSDRISSMFGILVDVGLISFIVALSCSWGQDELFGTAFSNKQTFQLPSLNIGVLQGNISIGDIRSMELRKEESIRAYTYFADKLQVPMLILPEGVINIYAPGIAGQLQQIAKHQNKEILTGAIEYLDSKPISLYESITDNVHNQNNVKQYINPLAGDNDFSFMETTNIIQSVNGKVGASTGCISIYPNLIADQVRKGAELLVNTSDLSTYGNDILGKQILAAAVIRAVENRRYMVLSTNTGVSAVIDPLGLVECMTPVHLKGVLIANVQFLRKKTPFTKMWWL